MDTLDPTIQALAKAIKKNETGTGDTYNAPTGKDGEVGAYRFRPDTWSAWAGKHLGNPNAPLSVENQNKVAYSQIKEWKDAGLNPAQIASKWNSGNENAYKDPNYKGISKGGAPYDVPAYARKVSQDYQAFRGGVTAKPLVQPKPEQGIVGSGVSAGLEAAKNMIPSAFNFAKGVLQTINPVQTLKNIEEIKSQFGQLSKEQGGAGQALISTIGATPQAAAESLIPQGVRQLATGDVSGAAETFKKDPFGQVAPLVFAAEGGAKALDLTKTKGLVSEFRGPAGDIQGPVAPYTKFTDTFGKGVETIAKPVTGTAEAISRGVGKMLPSAGIAPSIISTITGMEPATIRSIIDNPAEFTKLKQEAMSRSSLAEDFSKAIDDFVEGKADTGSEYGAVRTMEKPVTIPQDFFRKALEDFKFELDKEGQIKASTKSATRNPAEIKALQNFMDNWGDKKTLTPEEYLNMRSDMEGIARHGRELGEHPAAKKVGRSLYDKANKEIGSQIPGLRELDAKYAPQIEQFRQLKKDFLNPDGTFKDGAVSKIANAIGRGKENLLARMEKLSPGITKRIEILKAVEDIERSSGIKVGTYGRHAIAAAASIPSGFMGAIISEVLTSPQFIVPILRKYGVTKSMLAPILENLRILAGDINKGNMPEFMTRERQTKMGLSLLDVNKLTPFEKRMAGIKEEPLIKIAERKAAGFDSHTGLPLNKEGLIDTELAMKQAPTAYFEQLRQLAAENGNTMAKNFPGAWIEDTKKAYIERTNNIRSQRMEEGKPALEKGRASQSYKKLELEADIKRIGAERAKDLSPEYRDIETNAFQKVIQDEQGIINRYVARKGRIVNVDEIRKEFSDTGYNGTNAAAVQEPASYIGKKIFSQELRNGEGEFASFTGGGSGVGKSTALKGIPEVSSIINDSAVVLDSNLSNYNSAIKKINEAMQIGKKPALFFVFRDAMDSLVNGVIYRMINNAEEGGRVVPTKVIADNHIKSFETLKRLAKDGYEIVWVDNSLGKGNAVKTDLRTIEGKAKYPSVDKLTEMFNNKIKELYENKTPIGQRAITGEEYKALVE